MKISVKAAAKVNLLLDLTSTLQNSYHSIFTVMQSLSVFDKITVTDDNSGKLTLKCGKEGIPTDSRNTAYLAAKDFFEYTGIKNPGITIEIEKNIPVQAGMAGGSADAAGVIFALNKMFGEKLENHEMIKIGSLIGADVAFCLKGGTRLCLNKGEITAKLPDIPQCFFVVVKPVQNISTKQAYKEYDNAGWIRHCDRDEYLSCAADGNFDMMCAKAINVFEQVVEVNERAAIKAAMRKHNSKMCMMTGSGSAVFGVFEKESDAENCKNELLKRSETAVGKKPFSDVLIARPTEKAIYEV